MFSSREVAVIFPTGSELPTGPPTSVIIVCTDEKGKIAAAGGAPREGGTNYTADRGVVRDGVGAGRLRLRAALRRLPLGPGSPALSRHVPRVQHVQPAAHPQDAAQPHHLRGADERDQGLNEREDDNNQVVAAVMEPEGGGTSNTHTGARHSQWDERSWGVRRCHCSRRGFSPPFVPPPRSSTIKGTPSFFRLPGSLRALRRPSIKGRGVGEGGEGGGVGLSGRGFAPFVAIEAVGFAQSQHSAVSAAMLLSRPPKCRSAPDLSTKEVAALDEQLNGAATGHTALTLRGDHKRDVTTDIKRGL
ncbi:Protein of unknown function [Gryllus bimaculatus]|nr:Protein of unknown function [Gryllus bimaculatus]